jgi:hypothetical protein
MCTGSGGGGGRKLLNFIEMHLDYELRDIGSSSCVFASMLIEIWGFIYVCEDKELYVTPYIKISSFVISLAD